MRVTHGKFCVYIINCKLTGKTDVISSKINQIMTKNDSEETENQNDFVY